jgi:hypothetical protein
MRILGWNILTDKQLQDWTSMVVADTKLDAESQDMAFRQSASSQIRALTNMTDEYFHQMQRQDEEIKTLNSIIIRYQEKMREANYYIKELKKTNDVIL